MGKISLDEAKLIAITFLSEDFPDELKVKVVITGNLIGEEKVGFIFSWDLMRNDERLWVTGNYPLGISNDGHKVFPITDTIKSHEDLEEIFHRKLQELDNNGG